MERLRLNVDLLARTGGPGATLVVDEKQQIISASDPTWLGQSLAKAVILEEGRQRLADFFRTQEKTLQSVVFLSRDRQAVCAIFPLRIGASQDSIGFLYYEKNLQGLKAAAHQTLRRDIGVIFTLYAIIALLLWLFLYFFFFRRVSVIMETMRRFGHGEDSARSVLAGNDELADVATVLNSMLDQRVAADKLARKTDRLLKQLTDGLPLLLAYVDKEEHYRIVNREFEKWFYLKPEQIIGRQVRDMLGAKGLEEIADHVSLALTSGQMVEYEDTLPVVNDGNRAFQATLFPHFENGSGVVGCFLLARDITQHKIDMELLRKAQKQWECTFDSILDEIITVQDKEFRILQANKAAADYFGIPQEEIVGRHCYELFREDKIPCSGCPFSAVFLEGKTQSIELYHERVKKNFLVTISPMKDDQGKVFGIVHSAKDITEFKQMGQLLRQAQKMEAIGTLAGGIAHDFNNILSPILGYSEMVAERLPETAKSGRWCWQSTQRASGPRNWSNRSSPSAVRASSSDNRSRSTWSSRRRSNCCVPPSRPPLRFTRMC